MLPSPRYPLYERYQRVTTYYRRRAEIPWFYSGVINGISKKLSSVWSTTGVLWTLKRLNSKHFHRGRPRKPH